MKKLATIIIVLLTAVLTVFLFTKLVLPLLLGIPILAGGSMLLKTFFFYIIFILCTVINFVLLRCLVFILKWLNREEALEKK